ncbi:MAG: 7-carboxy-7-deazaguanine synthase QueE [Elusimicrobiota bacterium]|jgi:organic radical activating enzyme|nr:7-carboxy-7-deazaguanine synthase QueE [Elusimicrobiota bacterium]
MPQPLSAAEKLKVNEIFYSVQGEGKYTGAAAVFARLAGCTTGCKWCDTEYAAKVNFLMTPAQLLAAVKKYPARRVVLTGGEPCEQPLEPLIKLLHKNGYEIHLETNGSRDINTARIFCATVSPKKNVLVKMLKKADVIKLVVDGKTKKSEILKYKKYIGKKTSFFIQPEGNKKENLAKCLQIIKQNPRIRLSVQLHKLINIK